MAIDIEEMLHMSGLGYTKEVHPERQDWFLVPFDFSGEPLSLRISVNNGIFHAGNIFRRLDSLALKTTRKDLFLDLLKLNDDSLYAHVFIWTSQEDESEWIGVEAEVPSDSLTTSSALDVIIETARLTERVIQTITEHTTIPQRQLK